MLAYRGGLDVDEENAINRDQLFYKSINLD